MNAPNFLAKDRHGGFLFRRVIPLTIRHHFPQGREIRKSLKTYHRGIALRRARWLAAQTDHLFALTMKNSRYIDAARELRQLLDDKEVELALSEDDPIDAHAEALDWALSMLCPDPTQPEGARLAARIAALSADELASYEQRIREITYDRQNQIDELAAVTFDPSVAEVERINADLKANELKAKLIDEVHSREWQLRVAREAEAENGLSVGTLTRLVVPDAVLHAGLRTEHSFPQSEDEESISALWQTYRKQKLTDKEWKSEKIANGFDAMLRIFIELVGDLTPGAINRLVCVRYKDELMDYPIGRFKGKNAAISLAELKGKTTPMSLATRNNHMTTISTFVDWLMWRELLQANPFTAAKLIPKRDGRAEKREAFSTADLKQIFALDRFRGAYKRNWHYWIPLLGLFTGARMEELAQLRGMDITTSPETPGIWFLNIDDREDFTGKTASAVRVIPVHQKLIEMGLLDFVDAAGKEHLFPADPTAEGKRGAKMSNDFSRLKKELGFGKKHVFHSFRNTFIDALSRAGVNDSKISALVGHAQGSVTFRRYWTANEHELNDATKRINFDEVLVGIAKWKSNRP